MSRNAIVPLKPNLTVVLGPKLGPYAAGLDAHVSSRLTDHPAVSVVVLRGEDVSMVEPDFIGYRVTGCHRQERRQIAREEAHQALTEWFEFAVKNSMVGEDADG